MRLILLPTLAPALLAACSPQTERAVAPPQPEPVVTRAHADGLTVVTRLDDPSPTVVEDIKLRYSLIGSESLVASSPEWSASLPDELTLEQAVRLSGPPANRAGETPVATWDVTLTPLAPGDYEIAPITFTAADPESEQGELTVETEPLRISVESILTADDADLADLKDPFAAPEDVTTIALAVAGGALALAALIAGGVLLARRARRERPEPPIPPHERAMLELDALLATDLIDRRAWKAYHTELTALLRRYVEARFDIHAPAQTTDEFLRDPRTRATLSPEENAQLSDLLRRADLVKFAESADDEESARRAAETVRRFIHETAPRPDASEPAEAPTS